MAFFVENNLLGTALPEIKISSHPSLLKSANANTMTVIEVFIIHICSESFSGIVLVKSTPVLAKGISVNKVAGSLLFLQLKKIKQDD